MIDGVPLPGFSADEYTYYYNIGQEPFDFFPDIFAVAESPRAEVSICQPTAANPVAEIVVSHDDVKCGEAEPVVYRVFFVNYNSFSCGYVR